MASIDVAVFDVITGNLKFVKINNSDGLDEYYQHLQCDTFDITTREVDGIVFDIFCDDEGLLKDTPVVSAVNTAFAPVLCGNLIFTHHNEFGETTGITAKEYKTLKNHLILARNTKTGKSQFVLWGIDYAG